MLHCCHHCTTTPVPLHKDVAVHDLFSNSGAISSTSTAAPRIVAKRGFTHKTTGCSTAATTAPRRRCLCTRTSPSTTSSPTPAPSRQPLRRRHGSWQRGVSPTKGGRAAAASGGGVLGGHRGSLREPSDPFLVVRVHSHQRCRHQQDRIKEYKDNKHRPNCRVGIRWDRRTAHHSGVSLLLPRVPEKKGRQTKASVTTRHGR
ncbi:hypothetical protein PVAP13_3NG258145 [Panicum virgatum]|uniref:Uncharacterized protein n=1 Tax=Panicum virgatum TaxID=38727 RepID=A0A8T0UAH9_PANVG|nr:hypothetical protein PVAP13_3NG258145 [Panicum virgatum]